LTLFSVRFDNFCSPFGQFRIEAFHNAAHLSREVRTLGVVPRHFDRLLPERVGDRALIATALAKDDGHGVPQPVKRQARPYEPIFFEFDPHLAP
jgi:hypothetical protein